MVYLSTGAILRYQKGEDDPWFATLVESILEAPWGDTWKILVWGLEDTLEVGEDLLTHTKISSQHPNNLLEKDVLGVDIMR